MQEPKYAGNVRRGAALLDSEEQGWRDRISPVELDMEDCARCVVGQVMGLEQRASLDAFRSYDRIVRGLCGLKTHEYAEFEEAQIQHGFCIPDLSENADEEAEWNVLRDAWIGFIKEEWS